MAIYLRGRPLLVPLSLLIIIIISRTTYTNTSLSAVGPLVFYLTRRKSFEIPSKIHLRFPPIFMPRATKFPSFISLHHMISESESESIKMSDDSDSDFGFGSTSPLLDDNEPSTTTQELVVDGARG